jgi:hypothetical protein
MKPATQILCAALMTLACSAAFARTHALITVNPNNFAPGQNISKATVGAQLLAMYLAPDASGALVPQYSSGVYAQSMTPGCMVLDTLPCAPIGSNVLGYSGASTPSASPINWGDASLAVMCLQSAGLCFQGTTLETTPALRVNFDRPTNFVSALIPFREDGGFLTAFAYNSAGQPLFSCYGMGVENPGCTVTFFLGTNPEESWLQYGMSDPNSEISFVIIGGAGTLRPIAQIQFDSPVSLQLDGLLLKVTRVAPGAGLAIKVLFATVYYAVRDIPATCAMLTGFSHEVAALSGKHINALTASQLLSTTQAIESALSCQ